MLGAAALAFLPDHPTVADIVWREMLCGLGFGFFQAPNNREIMSSLPMNLTSVAAGMLATVRVLGQSLGAAFVAVIFALLGAKIVTSGSEHAIRNAMPIALWMAAAVAGAGAVASILRLRNEAPSDPRYL
jgi:DHA2 family multidrug resistance protein-like MFS transporter